MRRKNEDVISWLDRTIGEPDWSFLSVGEEAINERIATYEINNLKNLKKGDSGFAYKNVGDGLVYESETLKTGDRDVEDNGEGQ